MIASRSGIRGQGGARSSSVRRGRVAGRARSHHPLGQLHPVAVVGVGLVPLEHRELWVVLERHPLVAEVLADLVHPLEPGHDQPLQVQLRGDPQIEHPVELVVVGGEGPGQRAAVERLQHRRLDLDEAVFVEHAAHRGDHTAAGDGVVPRLLVDHQVEVALAVARLGVGQPVELLRQRPQRLGQQRPAGHPDGQLAAAAREHLALHSQQVAEVELPQVVVPRRDVRGGLQLDPPAGVDQVEEHGLAVAAPAHDPAGQPGPRPGLGVRRDVAVALAHLRGSRPIGEAVRVRLGAGRAQRIDLRQPVGADLLLGVVEIGVGHAR